MLVTFLTMFGIVAAGALLVRFYAEIFEALRRIIRWFSRF